MLPVYPTEIWMCVVAMGFMVMAMGLVMFGPFMPYIKAKFAKKKLLGVIDKTGNVKLMAADLRNSMYYFGDNPMRFIKQYPGSYRLGGVEFDIVHMDRGFVMKPEFQAAVAELYEQYGIEDYNQLKQALADGTITKSEIEIPLFFTVPLQEMERYGALVPPASITGEVDDLIQSMKKEEFQTLAKYLPWFLMFAVIIIAAALAVKIIG